MAFKPNYQQQRGDRARAKNQKKQEKLQRREEQSAMRKEPQPGDPAPPDSPAEAGTAPNAAEPGDGSD